MCNNIFFCRSLYVIDEVKYLDKNRMCYSFIKKFKIIFFKDVFKLYKEFFF